MFELLPLSVLIVVENQDQAKLPKSLASIMANYLMSQSQFRPESGPGMACNISVEGKNEQLTVVAISPNSKTCSLKLVSPEGRKLLNFIEKNKVHSCVISILVNTRREGKQPKYFNGLVAKQTDSISCVVKPPEEIADKVSYEYPKVIVLGSKHISFAQSDVTAALKKPV